VILFWFWFSMFGFRFKFSFSLFIFIIIIPMTKNINNYNKITKAWNMFPSWWWPHKMATLESEGYWNKMDETHVLTRPWKWNLGYYKVHVNLKMPPTMSKNSLSSFTFFWWIVDEINNGAISLSSEEGGYWKQGK
jgi:hypothetical protein